MAFTSKNAFALLGGEDDAPVAAAPKAAAAPAVQGEKPAAARNIPGSGRGAPRGASGAARGGARRAPDAGAAAAAGGDDAGAQQTRELREPRRGGRGGGEGGRGRGRGGRGGRGRQFDRHSATDRVDTEKNLRQGWGGEDGERELKIEQDAVTDAAAEAQPATNGTTTPAVAEGADGATPAAPVEEVDNTKTYEQYLAEMTAKKATLGGKAAAPRTVDADDSKWSGFGSKVVKGESGDGDYIASTISSNKGAGRQREKKEKQLLDIEQNFNTPPVASRGGPGGRGGGGGARGGSGAGRGRGEGRGRGGARGGARGGRGGASAGANVNLNDQSAFPTLS